MVLAISVLAIKRVRNFPRFPFSFKLGLAISFLTVGMTAISVSLLYTRLYNLVIEETVGHLKDAGQIGSFLFDEEAQARILRLKALSEAQSKPINAEILATAPGGSLLSLPTPEMERLMLSPDYQALVQILRRMSEGSRELLLRPQRTYAQPNLNAEQNPVTIATYLLVSLPESPDYQLVKFIASGLYQPSGNWPGNPIGNLYRVPDPIFVNAFEGRAQTASDFYTDDWGTWLTAVVPIKNFRGEVVAVLRLDFDASRQLNQVERLRWLCVGAVLISLGLSTIVALGLARWLGPPIAALQAGAERVRQYDYSTLVTLQGPGEIRRLAIAFNAMVQEIRTYATSLEEQNLTLEARVQERTQELTQALDLLKATQTDLMLENAFLRCNEPLADYYQVGGSLPIDAPTYVVRQADRFCYQALRQGRYCAVLNARQMGKSSLRVQMIKRMQAEGVRCASIDLSILGDAGTTIEQWYTGIIYMLMRELKLSMPGDLNTGGLKEWLRKHQFLAPIQRLDAFMQEVVLEQVSQRILIFVDEIDSVLHLDFSADDFFIWIRNCFHRQVEQGGDRRLAFALFGVATPADLIQSPSRTPFNIGQTIHLEGFRLHETYPLLQGLPDAIARPQVVMHHVLAWTGGQPFLTQKVCQLLGEGEWEIPTGAEEDAVAEVVRSQLIENWEVKDEPIHLRTIRDRLLDRLKLLPAMLDLYELLLEGVRILANDSPEQTELRLSGLVVQWEGELRVANRIYAAVFDLGWVSGVRSWVRAA